MKNSDYWRVRAMLLEETLHNKSIAYDQTLEREFKRASQSIQRDIEAWCQRFADNNGISMAEARRWLTSAELKEFKWRIEDYIAYGQENAINQKWMKELENASARYHISRLEALQLDLQQQAEVLYGNQLDALDSHMRDVYSQGYNHTAYEIQRGVGIGWKLQGINNRQLDRALSKPWGADGKTFSSRLWGQREKLINAVQTQLSQTIIRGAAPDKAIKAIADQFNVSRKQAGRLVMTESAYMAAEAQGECYRDLGVEQFEIIAALDGKTCTTCGGLDSKVVPTSAYEPGVTANPFHAGCRCCTAPYFSDNYGERIARDPKTGKTYNVPSDMNYEEWYQKYVVDKYGADEAALMKKMSTNETADKAQYKKYKGIFGKDAPKNLEEFQRLKYTDSERWDSLKASKQETLNSLDYKKSLDKMLGNTEVRNWYNEHDKNIASHIDTSKPLKDQAAQAHNLRNTYKQQARNMMKDAEGAERLSKERPLMDFDYYYKKYSEKYKTVNEIYKAIIDSSTRANKQVNKMLGLE